MKISVYIRFTGEGVYILSGFDFDPFGLYIPLLEIDYQLYFLEYIYTFYSNKLFDRNFLKSAYFPDSFHIGRQK